MSEAMRAARAAAVPALLELVRLKGVKERVAALEAKMEAGEATLEVHDELDALRKEHAAKKDKAWANARAVFGSCSQCRRRWDQDCWHVICARRAEGRARGL